MKKGRKTIEIEKSKITYHNQKYNVETINDYTIIDLYFCVNTQFVKVR